MRIAALLLVLATAKVVGIAGRHLSMTGWMPVALFWHDAAVVIVFAAFEGAAVVHRTRRARWTGALYALIVIYVVVNVPMVRVLATPMTWPMWRATRGPLADSILHYATLETLLACSLVSTLAIVAPTMLRRVDRGAGRAATVAALLIVALGPWAAARVETRGLERNAWTALIAGFVPLGSADASGWSWIGIEENTDPDLRSVRGAGAGLHVVLVSLESTAAQYLGLSGTSPDVMPNLSALAEHAIVFDNAYAVYPESIKGLFALLCSACPSLNGGEVSYQSTPCASIGQALARRGYRTALFHSGRFDYLGMDVLVRDRGYEIVADAGDIGGSHESSFGIDEPSTVAAVLDWIDGLPRGRRFFVTYLPIAGHHPYNTPARGLDHDLTEEDRYRNALRYADASLGLLIRGLAARGLSHDVLWVIVGDHGEAFGQHDGNFGHTFQLFEENVHVPLVIAAPGRFSRQTRVARPVSVIDVAPTVIDLLSGDVGPSPHDGGQSLLSGPPRMVYFFTNYSKPLAGVRDGRMKTIVELDTGRAQLFDLARDSGEKTDLAERLPERASWYARNARNRALAR